MQLHKSKGKIPTFLGSHGNSTLLLKNNVPRLVTPFPLRIFPFLQKVPQTLHLTVSKRGGLNLKSSLNLIWKYLWKELSFASI